MALSNVALPYGIRDIKLTPYTDAAGLILSDTSIDLPNARTLSFSDTEEFQELRGDDRVVATHGNGSAVSWNLESGGLPFQAFKIMGGGTVTDSGASPNARKVYAKKVTDQRPYFKVEGQAISDSGGDVHVELHRCKATGSLEGSFSDGEFYLTAADGVALAMPEGPLADEIYRFVYNESITGITGPAPIVTNIVPEEQGVGEFVTILGSGFTAVTGVTFDGTPGTGLVVVNDNALNIALPAGDAGDVPVILTTSGGSSIPFTYTRG